MCLEGTKGYKETIFLFCKVILSDTYCTYLRSKVCYLQINCIIEIIIVMIDLIISRDDVTMTTVPADSGDGLYGWPPSPYGSPVSFSVSGRALNSIA